jgi:hypothetical protein
MPSRLARHCAGCFRLFQGDPVYLQDTPFCCASCAAGALCSCFAEVDRAADGVDGLGLAFGAPSLVSPDSQVPVRSR